MVTAAAGSGHPPLAARVRNGSGVFGSSGGISIRVRSPTRDPRRRQDPALPHTAPSRRLPAGARELLRVHDPQPEVGLPACRDELDLEGRRPRAESRAEDAGTPADDAPLGVDALEDDRRFQFDPDTSACPMAWTRPLSRTSAHRSVRNCSRVVFGRSGGTAMRGRSAHPPMTSRAASTQPCLDTRRASTSG